MVSHTDTKTHAHTHTQMHAHTHTHTQTQHAHLSLGTPAKSAILQLKEAKIFFPFTPSYNK